MIHKWLALTISIAWLCAVSPVAGVEPAESEFSEQRELYQQALHALRKNQRQKFKALSEQLHEYPLYPYIVYQDLLRRLSVASKQEISEFTSTYQGIPVAERLMRKWLWQLYRRGDWKTFLEVYNQSSDVRLQCYYLRAKIKAGDTDQIEERIKDLWLVSRSQPHACNPLFAWFEKQGYLTTELIWQRIELAMQSRKLGLARYLADKLDSQSRALVKTWQTVYRRPAKGVQVKQLSEDTTLNRKIVAFGVKRLAAKDLDKALVLWDQLNQTYNFDEQHAIEVDRYLALLAAKRHRPDAWFWLSQIDSIEADSEVRLWKAKAALRQARWKDLIQAIKNLNQDEREQIKWQYWLARSFERLGASRSARTLFYKLAKERHYYGFLAADRLKLAYEFNSVPVGDDETVLVSLLNKSGLIRAHELYLLKDMLNARREWNSLITGLDREELMHAAVIAYRWGWYGNSIRALTKSEFMDDLELRFPTPYFPKINDIARNNGIEAAWIYGVMRRESIFIPDARSPKGALGLMQLMPATARQVARRNGYKRPRRSDLIRADVNIKLGSAYLRQLVDRFDGNQVLATAAYNAGPHRVDRWLPNGTDLDADLWIDTIPFTETRRFVKAVLAYTAIFEDRLNGKPTRLSQRMPVIKTKANDQASQQISQVTH